MVLCAVETASGIPGQLAVLASLCSHELITLPKSRARAAAAATAAGASSAAAAPALSSEPPRPFNRQLIAVAEHVLSLPGPRDGMVARSFPAFLS